MEPCVQRLRAAACLGVFRLDLVWVAPRGLWVRVFWWIRTSLSSCCSYSTLQTWYRGQFHISQVIRSICLSFRIRNMCLRLWERPGSSSLATRRSRSSPSLIQTNLKTSYLRSSTSLMSAGLNTCLYVSPWTSRGPELLRATAVRSYTFCQSCLLIALTFKTDKPTNHKARCSGSCLQF